MGKVHKEPIYEWENTTVYHPYKRHSIANQGNMKQWDTKFQEEFFSKNTHF